MPIDEMKSKVAVKIYQLDSGVRLAAHAIKWLGIVLISYFVFRTVDALAGQTTVANFDIDMFRNLSPGQIVAAIWAGAATVFGLAERNLRRRTIERLQARITDLEGQIDAKRTSSQLTTRGETRPEDKL